MIKIYKPSSKTLHRAEQAIRAVLPRSVKIRVAKRDTRADLIINGRALQIKWLGEGTLGAARRVVADRPDIVVARCFSPGARETLSKEGIGWLDETGAAEIAIESIIISRTGKPLKAAERPMNWSPAVIAVAEALLCGTKATISATQETTRLSAGSCTHALQVLTKLHLLEAGAKRGRQSGRQITDEDKLLAAYASAIEAQPTPISLQIGVVWPDLLAGLEKTGKKWNKAKLPWAATGTTAASVLAPYITQISSADVYVDASTIIGLEAVAADVGLRPIEGGRLTLKPFPTVTVRQLSEEINGLRVAPWPRVYADLLTTGVRGEEAAEHLREVIHTH